MPTSRTTWPACASPKPTTPGSRSASRKLRINTLKEESCRFSREATRSPPERGERVASLENRHDSSFRVFIRNFLDALRDPGVVGFGEAQAGHVVLDVGIEARRDEDHVRPELDRK